MEVRTDRNKKQNNIAIVLSAGQGSRMHADVPKQYMELCGMPVVAWPLKIFQEYDGIQEIILVTGAEDIDYCRSEIREKYGLTKISHIVAGGAERCLSVWNGLQAAAGADYVFIHDGARPLIDDALLDRALACVQEHGACVAGMPVKDTIKIADEEGFAKQTPDRRLLWQVQTPQVFSFPLIFEAYRRLMEEGVTAVTDDAMVVELETGTRVKLFEGSYRNLKITTPEDMEIARHLMKEGRL